MSTTDVSFLCQSINTDNGGDGLLQCRPLAAMSGKDAPTMIVGETDAGFDLSKLGLPESDWVCSVAGSEARNEDGTIITVNSTPSEASNGDVKEIGWLVGASVALGVLEAQLERESVAPLIAGTAGASIFEAVGLAAESLLTGLTNGSVDPGKIRLVVKGASSVMGLLGVMSCRDFQKGCGVYRGPGSDYQVAQVWKYGVAAGAGVQAIHAAGTLFGDRRPGDWVPPTEVPEGTRVTCRPKPKSQAAQAGGSPKE